MVIQSARLKGLAGLRVKGWIGGFFKGQGRGLLDVDMIRVAVAPDRIEGQYDVWLQLPDVFDNLAGDFFDRMVDLGVGMLVVFRTRHTRIAVVQKENFFQTKYLGCAAQFRLAFFSRALEVSKVLGFHDARFAPCCADQVHIVAFIGIERQRAAHAEGLIVWMCQHCKDGMMGHEFPFIIIDCILLRLRIHSPIECQSFQEQEKMNIGIYIYDEVEVLDFTGPFEVLTTADRVYSRMNPEAEDLFHVYLLAENLRSVQARNRFNVQPHHSIQSHPELEVLIIPGGVHAEELEKARVMQWISKTSKAARLTASVCTGAFLLAKAGVLVDQACTTHWEDIAGLREMFPRLDVREGIPWVDAGSILTSAGISAGIDMALHLVTRLAGKDLALRTAHQMQYRWNYAYLSKE